MNNVKVRQLFDYDTWTYTYLVWSKKTKEAVIIDSVIEQVSRDLELVDKLNLKLKYILETHVHADHITGAYSIKTQTDAKICYGSKTGVEGSDLYLKDNQEIATGGVQIKAIHTPGHTSGCTSYYTKGFIFTGDTLFIGSTGRTDFQEGSMDAIYNSVREKIYLFPDNTIVYPGHNYNGLTSSTIKEEKEHNPNVGVNVTFKEFEKLELSKKRPYPKRFDVAVPANMKCGKIE